MSIVHAELHRPGDRLSTLAPGHTLSNGAYTVGDMIGWGAFGITYVGKDHRSKTVVIREFFPSHLADRSETEVTVKNPEDQKSFDAALYLSLQEGRSFARLSHPSLASVDKAFEENGTGYIVSEFVDGIDVQEIIDTDTDEVDPELVSLALIKLLEGLEQVHNAGLLHRDIKPENIIVAEDDCPVLIDFGSPLKGVSPTLESGSELPKPVNFYDPHEYFVIGSKQGPSADLYSLGASFYHLITGTPPADCQDRMAAFLGNTADPYVPLGDLTDKYSQAFCNAINCSLSLIPRYRMRSAKEWRDMLTSLSAHTTPSRKTSVLS